MNTSSTRVEVRWNVAHTGSLSPSQRARVIERLATRIARDGTLRVVAGARRSQAQNRDAAIARMTALVTAALHVPKARRATKPPKSAAERRLREKRQRALRKERRRPPGGDDA